MLCRGKKVPKPIQAAGEQEIGLGFGEVWSLMSTGRAVRCLVKLPGSALGELAEAGQEGVNKLGEAAA